MRQLTQGVCTLQLGSGDAHPHAPYPNPDLSGTLPPAAIAQAGCGTDYRPLVLEAQPGQQIALTMLDFYATGNGSSSMSRGASSCASVYGQLYDLESEQSQRICGGGGQRQTRVILTSAHRLQIKIELGAAAKFMLQFKGLWLSTNRQEISKIVI